MSVVAMKCVSAEDHPDADRLRVYKFESPASWEGIQGVGSIQVVANLTNIYEVGDIVAVAEVGSVLSAFDDMKIEARKVRGVESFGMALGVVDVEVGTELGDDYSPGD